MLTQCPGCQTVFRITETILRAAHGQVRCGRCNTQFDAMQNGFEQEELIDDESASPPQDEATAENEAAEFLPTFNDDTAQSEQITMEGDQIFDATDQADQESMLEENEPDDSVIEIFNIDSEEWHNPFPTSESTSEAAAIPEPDVSVSSSHTDELTRARPQFFGEETDEQPLFVENSVENHDGRLYGDGGNNAQLFNNAVYRNEPDSSSKEQSLEDEPSLFKPESNDTRLRHWTTSKKILPKESPPDVLQPDQYVEAYQSNSRWRMMLTCIGLVLLLAIQVVHHYRQSLVRHPGFGDTLKSIYSVFGQNLEPRWEVNAYSIKQWGIVSDPQEPGILRVRASITNNANFAQPYPLLKLTLEDRFGSHLGTRAFKPIEYLPSATSATRLLDAGVAANVDLAIVDPGEDAVGFQFDSCLGNEQSMQCAHE